MTERKSNRQRFREETGGHERHPVRWAFGPCGAALAFLFGLFGAALAFYFVLIAFTAITAEVK